MKEISLECWEDYLKKIDQIQTSVPKKKLFFRGQSNEEWALNTTLDRKQNEYSFGKYLLIARRVAPQIEAYTGKSWSLPSDEKLNEEIANIEQKDPIWIRLSMESWLVYLRHHGFPSPLLDWTESPFIAAYFAYSVMETGKDPAIFLFEKNDSRVELYGEPKITFTKKYLETDKRHFTQKARYTMATKRMQNEMVFCDHKEALIAAGKLTKFVLPWKERKKVLTYMNNHNINSFTLFHSEDSLLAYLSAEFFDLS